MNQTFLAFPVCLKSITQFYNTFLQKIISIYNRNNRNNRERYGGIVRALQRAHVFAARKVHWTLCLSGSALRITFSRYALSEKVGRRARFCSPNWTKRKQTQEKQNNIGKL